MGYIPPNAKWYVAELVQSIKAEGQETNLVWRNLTLIEADSPEEAYQKALRFGEEGSVSYRNSDGKQVNVCFQGISHLDVIHDELKDGAELLFRSNEDMTDEAVKQLIPTKEELNLFRPIQMTWDAY